MPYRRLWKEPHITKWGVVAIVRKSCQAGFSDPQDLTSLSEVIGSFKNIRLHAHPRGQPTLLLITNAPKKIKNELEFILTQNEKTKPFLISQIMSGQVLLERNQVLTLWILSKIIRIYEMQNKNLT